MSRVVICALLAMMIWPSGALLWAQAPTGVDSSLNDANGGELKLDREFVSVTSEANRMEIALAQIALQRTQVAAICSFADSMVDDFRIAQQELVSVAQQEGIAIKDTPDIDFERRNFGIGVLTGKNFDSAYKNMQLLDHQIAIRWFETEVKLGQDSLCRQYAARYLPKLKHYLLLARDLWTKPPPDGRPASEPDEHWPYH